MFIRDWDYELKKLLTRSSLDNQYNWGGGNDTTVSWTNNNFTMIMEEIVHMSCEKYEENGYGYSLELLNCFTSHCVFHVLQETKEELKVSV